MVVRVLWKVSTIQQMACPDYKPNVYTGQYPQTHCAVLHTGEVITQRGRDFGTLEEAKAFIMAAPIVPEPQAGIAPIRSLGDAYCFDFQLQDFDNP